jgi:hypothetical protein
LEKPGAEKEIVLMLKQDSTPVRPQEFEGVPVAPAALRMEMLLKGAVGVVSAPDPLGPLIGDS